MTTSVMPATAFKIFEMTPFGMRMSPLSTVANWMMELTVRVVRFSDRTITLELISSTASMTRESSTTDTRKSLSVIAVCNALRFSLTVFSGSGVIVYRVPFRAMLREALTFVEVIITTALLKFALEIAESAEILRLVAGFVSVAISVPAGTTVPSSPVQRM